MFARTTCSPGSTGVGATAWVISMVLYICLGGVPPRSALVWTSSGIPRSTPIASATVSASDLALATEARRFRILGFERQAGDAIGAGVDRGVDQPADPVQVVGAHAHVVDCSVGFDGRDLVLVAVGLPVDGGKTITSRLHSSRWGRQHLGGP